jgi:probable poly-beta-1,6-N-acetyl-D-glucosamine export protein
VFLSFIHSFRAIAILMVISTHALDALRWPDPSWVKNLLLSLMQNASVPFVLVAGFLFQHLSARFSYGRYLWTKTLFVIVPYVIWSVPILVYDAIHGIGVYTHHIGPIEDVGRTLRALVTAEYMPAPLWYIPFIAVIYLVAPLLLALDRHARLYFLCIPLLIMATLCHRPAHLTDVGQSLLYFAPVYLVGMWLARERDRALRFAERHLGTLIGVFFGMTWFEVCRAGHAGAIYSRAPFSMEHGVFDLNLVSKLIGSLALMVVLRRGDRLVAPRLAFLADISFGLFFVHEYVVMVIERVACRLGYQEGIPGGSRDFLLVVLLAVLGGIAIIWTLKKVLGTKSRYIIGC